MRRNPVWKLHGVAPEQIWAEDPIANNVLLPGKNRNRNHTEDLHRNFPELRQVSAPEPFTATFGTSPSISTRTLQNPAQYLDRNLQKFHHTCAQEHFGTSPNTCFFPRVFDLASAPEPSKTSSAICAGTLPHFIGYLHWNAPDLTGHPLRNLNIHLHLNPSPEPDETSTDPARANLR